MKNKLLLFGLGLLIVFTACNKRDKGAPPSTTPPNTSNPSSAPYSITENFDQGVKPGYADANVTLSTGSWDFNDALLAGQSADLKDGAQSVRIRNGDIAMNFDIKGLQMLYIRHGKYGSDAASTWQLEISADSGKTYTQLGNTINETNTTLVTDSFKVTTTGKVRFEIKKSGTTRINIDDITFKGTGDSGMTVTNPGTGKGTSGTDTLAYEPPRNVTPGPDAPPASGDNSNLLLGNPSNAQAAITMKDNFLIDQKYYTESYNATKSEPNWVSWHLDATNITGNTDRLNDFAGWAGINPGWFQVESNGYEDSGFDRGHNCPSADRTSSFNANAATFLMTNMIPQAPNNNQSTWANLENYLRDQVTAGNELYIIMGSYGSGGTGSKGTATSVDTGRVNVPSNIWKVAVIIPAGNNDISRITTATRVIAVNTPNINSIDQDWTKYIVTIKDIETATGYTLLSALPANVRTALETKKDAGQ